MTSSGKSLPTATATLTRYAESDSLVLETLESLSLQKDVRLEVLFLDQDPSEELERRLLELGTELVIFRYEKIPARSLSHARNLALERATNDVVLFIDSDAIADPTWAACLAESLTPPDVGVVGGQIVPRWHGEPLIIAKSRLVREQYSLLELGPGRHEMSKVVGASFGVHRIRLSDDAYFDERLGRQGGVLLGGEEADLCDRCLARRLRILYDGRALVHHQIGRERISYRWILRRFYYGGFSRAIRSDRRPRPTHPMRWSDYAVLPLVLPAYALGYVRGRRSNR